ncbi:hypothetical protein TNCT_687231 [Trichonephila clavata]|uniref:Uncharacterized protein n=1 Tax=Trichonephila clavata TaxID=2740835 RepID=A0A8X6I8Y2_TRICU|nr:hypothetical protein TNCT_687231 [Trichonephila clavata]
MNLEIGPKSYEMYLKIDKQSIKLAERSLSGNNRFKIKQDDNLEGQLSNIKPSGSDDHKVIESDRDSRDTRNQDSRDSDSERNQVRWLWTEVFMVSVSIQRFSATQFSAGYHSDNDNVMPGAAGDDVVQRNVVQVQRRRCICLLCRRLFCPTGPQAPRVCPSCRQDENQDINPLAERARRRQRLFRRFFL